MTKKNIVLINRELSWLAFNDRVLQEAEDKTVPLIERLKFLGIYSNNRDEFFRVRVATVRRAVKHQKKALELMGEDPVRLLNKIQKIVIAQQMKFENIYQEIIKELEQQNVFIINEEQLLPAQGAFVKSFFREKVKASLFPIMLDNTSSFPYLKDKSGYLIIKLGRAGKAKKSKYAIIEVPDEIPRFLVLPKDKDKNYVILLDDVIRYSLDEIFQNFDNDHIEAYNIKLTRDAELDIDNDLSKSFVEKISKSLKARKKGQPVRLVYDSQIAPDMLDFVMKKIKIGKDDNPIPGGRYHNFKDFISFPNVGGSELYYKKNKPLQHPAFRNQTNLLKVIRSQDVLLTYPYQSFDHIIDLLREASIDPKVQSIKITLYRVAKNSSIVKALINALKNGKQVTVVVELQARFDEEANIYWSDKLLEEGAKIIYGVPGLKVHSKLFLITRKEGGKLNHYAHLGTGNFNGETARVYTDHTLLTCNKLITEEVEKVFTFYSDNFRGGNYKHLLVSPFFMRKSLVQLINKEIKNAKAGKKAWITLKINNLVDENMIRKLYEASSEGVQIRLIVRGICSLVPGIKGMSDNIEAISIVDKYLEHSRVFIFCNGGEEKYFLSSADWMARNLDHRSEVSVPVYDEEIQKQLRIMTDTLWADNVKARILESKQNNEYRKAGENKKVRAQEEIYKLFKLKKI